MHVHSVIFSESVLGPRNSEAGIKKNPREAGIKKVLS